MSDRHTFSDPRPVTSGTSIPTWEVDVLRDGKLVFTLRIDSQNLPPRRRKKKIVWKLPGSTDQIPQFGTDEKRRLMELFKQAKKDRRKKGKDEDENDGNSDEDEQRIAPQPTVEKPINNSNNNLQDETTKSSADAPSQPRSKKKNYRRKSSSSKKDAIPTEKQPPQQPSSSPPPDTIPPPPGILEKPTAPPPPTVESTSNNETTETTTTITNEPTISSQEPSKTPPPPGFATDLTTRTDHALYFLLNTTTPAALDSLGHMVAQVYYTLLQQGRVEELLRYFHPKAVKSLTVSSAHAVTHTPEERELQLRSQVVFQFHVTGILCQPTSSSSSCLMITTGTCVWEQQTFPFCHTLLLEEVTTESLSGRYQIHNDALALLNGG